MELKRILPDRIYVALDRLDKSKLCELRLRKGGVSVNYGGSFYGLSESGLSKVGMKMTAEEIDGVVLKASGYSVYAVNDQIKNGYLSLGNGVRMGICGEVSEKTIKAFSSLNIRFPHEIKGCSDELMSVIARKKGCYNTLIVSPPGCGKTTLLRDMIRNLSNRGNNVLVADERRELSGGDAALDLGVNTDVISGGDKSFAFSRGIRYMRPDILCADEIMSEEDEAAIELACKGGVNVVASLHGDGRRKSDISCMERIIVLSDRGGPGKIEGVFDKNGSRLI